MTRAAPNTMATADLISRWFSLVRRASARAKIAILTKPRVLLPRRLLMVVSSVRIKRAVTAAHPG